MKKQISFSVLLGWLFLLGPLVAASGDFIINENANREEKRRRQLDNADDAVLSVRTVLQKAGAKTATVRGAVDPHSAAAAKTANHDNNSPQQQQQQQQQQYLLSRISEHAASEKKVMAIVTAEHKNKAALHSSSGVVIGPKNAEKVKMATTEEP